MLKETTSSSFVKKLKLDVLVQEIVERLALLPIILVTRPEDGNRKAQPGEKYGPKLVRDENFLGPPVRKKKKKSSKQDKEKR